MGLITNDQNKNFVFLKLGKDKEDSDGKFCFQQIEKNDEGKYVITNKVPGVTGYLSSIKYEDKVYNNQTIEEIKFTLIDDEDENTIYYISTNFNNVTRSFVNTLAGQKHLGLLRLYCYMTEKSYPAISVQVDGEKSDGWKYSIDELPNKEVITDSKGNYVKTVYDEQNQFFKDVIENEIKPLIEKSGIKKSISSSSKTSDTNSEKPVEATTMSGSQSTSSVPNSASDVDFDDDGDDELPF